MNWQCHRQQVYFVNSLVLHKSGICEKCFQLFLVKLLHCSKKTVFFSHHHTVAAYMHLWCIQVCLLLAIKL